MPWTGVSSETSSSSSSRPVSPGTTEQETDGVKLWQGVEEWGDKRRSRCISASLSRPRRKGSVKLPEVVSQQQITQEDSHFDSSIDDSMYSILFPRVFLHVLWRWGRRVVMQTCFSIFPSGLVTHGGPHRNPSPVSAHAEKFTFLASSFVRLLLAIKSNNVKRHRFLLNVPPHYQVIIHTREGVGIKMNDSQRSPDCGPDWVIRGRICRGWAPSWLLRSWVLCRGLYDGL